MTHMHITTHMMFGTSALGLVLWVDNGYGTLIPTSIQAQQVAIYIMSDSLNTYH